MAQSAHRLNDDDRFISALTIAEIWRGLLELPKGKKRPLLEAWFTGADGPQALFVGRLLPFDEKAAMVWAQLMAEVWAQLMAEGSTRGRPGARST